MNKKSICLLLLGSIFYTYAFSITEFKDNLYDQELTRGLDLIFRQKYDSAYFLADSLIKSDSAYPTGYFLLLSTTFTQFQDYKNIKIMDLFSKRFEKVLGITKQNDSDIFMFYRGCAYSLAAVISSQNKNWFKSLMYSKRSDKIFRNLNKKEINSGDILGMLGAYDYWASDFFNWIPFIESSKSDGILQLKLALKRAKYMKFALYNSLLWIYYDNKKYDSSLVICNKVLNKYPDNRIFRKAKIDILYRMRKYNKAKIVGFDLSKNYEKIKKKKVGYYSVLLKYCMILYKNGDIERSKNIYKKIINSDNYEYLVKFYAQDLKEYKELIKGKTNEDI